VLNTVTLSCLAGLIAIFGAPARAQSVPSVTLRAMTYNIQYGGGSIETTSAAIRAADPDLVALQEVDVRWGARSAFVDQASVLAERLGMQVRFAPIYQLPGADASSPPREFGVALLSKYPITSFANRPLTRHSTQAESAPPSPAPGLLDATVEVRGTPIRVLNTHLDYRPDPAVRHQQVQEVLAAIGASTSPIILFGDFNAAPTAPELQPLLARLRDSWPASAGPGWTYPALEPTERIDYVLVSPQFRVVAARVPDTKASDHRPVVVDLILASPRR
jgi:endonuclease/exonuclease/phosphatase family metal-dependent hydrolase